MDGKEGVSVRVRTRAFAKGLEIDASLSSILCSFSRLLRYGALSGALSFSRRAEADENASHWNSPGSSSDAAGGTHSMIDVQRVDYIRIPVTDMEKANHFYREVLGLQRNQNSPGEDWVEYEAGNVTLALMTPHTHD
jgi:glyoxalase/bleomycin resistance protein/dioxygenase superfamily protein